MSKICIQIVAFLVRRYHIQWNFFTVCKPLCEGSIFCCLYDCPIVQQRQTTISSMRPPRFLIIRNQHKYACLQTDFCRFLQKCPMRLCHITFQFCFGHSRHIRKFCNDCCNRLLRAFFHIVSIDSICNYVTCIIFQFHKCKIICVIQIAACFRYKFRLEACIFFSHNNLLLYFQYNDRRIILFYLLACHNGLNDCICHFLGTHPLFQNVFQPDLSKNLYSIRI